MKIQDPINGTKHKNRHTLQACQLQARENQNVKAKRKKQKLPYHVRVQVASKSSGATRAIQLLSVLLISE
jgi:hypothetical protein